MAQLKDLLVNGDAKFLADVILDHDPTANLHAATKAYVDAQVSTGSDEKLKVGALTSGTEYLPILAIATDSGTAATRQIDKNAQAFKYICTPGTSGAAIKGTAELVLGNGLSEGYANAASGALTIFGTGIYGVTLKYGGGYTGQTLYLPNPTAGNQTNYLVSKSVANGVGAVDQPVYVDVNGQIAAANKNPWNKNSHNSVYSPIDPVWGPNLQEGLLVFSNQNSKNRNCSNAVKTSVASQPTLLLNQQVTINLSSEHPAGSTTYTLNMNSVQGDGTLPQFTTDNLFYYDESVGAQHPTSVTISSTHAVLTFSTSLNPNTAITSLYGGNHIIDSATSTVGANIIAGTDIVSGAAQSIIIGSSNNIPDGSRQLIVGQNGYSNVGPTIMIGARLKNTNKFTALIGDTLVSSVKYAALFGVGHLATTGPEAIFATGKYSSIGSTTLFAVGNGTSASARSNAFEVTTTGEAKAVSFTENGTALASKYAAISHTHSDSTGITIASSDKIAIFDASDSYKLKSALSFDTTVSDQWLCKNGTWSAPTGLQPGSHSHGHVQNDGTMSDSTGTAVATGDKLVITQANGTLSTSSISFDTTNTNKVLTQAGTWVTLETSTDEKLALNLASAGTTYQVLLGTNSNTAAIRQRSSELTFLHDSSSLISTLTIGEAGLGRICFGESVSKDSRYTYLRPAGSGPTGSANALTVYLPYNNLLNEAQSHYLISASQRGTAIGSTTKNVYISTTGVVTEGSTYAGGTALTVNGTSKSGNTASIYAPESAPTASTGYWVGYTSGTGAAWKKLSPAIATESTTSGTSLSFGSKYKLTVGGESAYFTMPGNPNTNYYHSAGSWSGLTYTFGKVGSPGDIAITLPTGTTSTTVALGNHTHSLSLAETTNTPDLAIAFNKAYQITGGGNTFVFTTPQLPTIPTISLNGSSTTSPSFYAPTSAGSSGYVLQSNGSGAPTWVDVGTITGDTKVTQTTVTGTSTTSLYPILLAYGTGQTATTTNTANFTANASISPSGDLWVNKVTSSTTFNYGANAYTQYNSTLKAIEFCFA